MTRYGVAAAAVLLWLAAGLPAQHHTAGWSFTASASSASPTPVAVGKFDNAGKLTTILKVSQLPQNVYVAGGTLDFDDKTYVIALLSKVINGSLLKVDQSGTILQTIQVLSTNPQQGGGFTWDVTLDPNADYVVAVGAGGGTPNVGLHKVDRSGNVTTLVKGAPFADPGAVTTEIDTGRFLVLDPRNRAVYSVAPDGSAVTSIGTFATTTSVLRQITQQIGSGDLFVGSYQRQGAVLLRMDMAGNATTFLASGLFGAYGVHADRSSAAAPRLAVGSAGNTSGVYFVDLATRAITTLARTSSISYNQVFPDREVATIRRGPGKWEITLHYAGQAGNAYVVGLGLSGVRPGVGLPDGRRILLNADNLTGLSVTGQLGPIFTRNVGTLNAFDRASALLDVSSLPVKGVAVWALALTLNPGAPLGIHTLSDPVRITL